MPETPSTTPEQRRAAVYPSIEVDPDFHIPPRREGRLARFLHSVFGRTRPASS